MFWKEEWSEVVRLLDSHPEKGLTEEEAGKRLKIYGKNTLKERRPKTLPESFFEQLNDPLIYVLLGAAAISLGMGEHNDAMIIGIVVFMNALVGMIQEGKARRALDGLKKLTSPQAVVIREGISREIPAAQLVPGDLVRLETGNQVPADVRLIRVQGLKTEEAAMTGESLPAEKIADCLKEDAGLGDRRNMAYMSTLVTGGRAEGIVVATGMETEIGKIAGMITEKKEEVTPLQKKLGELGTVLSILTLLLCAGLFAIAVMQKRDILKMLLTAISLAVAAVPEGLPAVVTICLALSVTRMVRINTIVRKLPAVETLGAVNVICSDKTGTLTQNKMTVEKGCWDRTVYSTQKKPFELFLKAMVLCNNAIMNGEQAIGDPTELALLVYAQQHGMRKEKVEESMPRLGEREFDSVRKRMSTIHGGKEGTWVFCKGAPESVLSCCDRYWEKGREKALPQAVKEEWLKEVQSMSSEGLRTLALAMKQAEKGETNRSNWEPEEKLIFLGMVGMKDPPRPEALNAIRRFQCAGVDTVMITGDHVDTACAIGKQLGIVADLSQCMSGEELERCDQETLEKRLETTRVFARTSPAQKVLLVKGFQKKGKIVAMTGDGVNDAPSLKAADIGIAMGKTGTDVAKQAADMILTDDHFATIEKAMEEGRSVYENIRKAVIFLLSSNLGEILTMFAAVLCGFASPLKSAHILWINLITDSLPALALGADSNDTESLMNQPPRGPKEGMFSRGGLSCTLFYGVLIAGISLVAFLQLPLGILWRAEGVVTLDALRELLEEPALLLKSRTYAFTVLGMSQLIHAVGMRDTGKSVFSLSRGKNLLMTAALAVGFFLQLAVTELPILTETFETATLDRKEWFCLGLLALIPLLSHELGVLFGSGKQRS